MNMSRFHTSCIWMPYSAPVVRIQESCCIAWVKNLNMSRQMGSEPHAAFLPDQERASQPYLYVSYGSAAHGLFVVLGTGLMSFHCERPAYFIRPPR